MTTEATLDIRKLTKAMQDAGAISVRFYPGVSPEDGFVVACYINTKHWPEHAKGDSLTLDDRHLATFTKHVRNDAEIDELPAVFTKWREEQLS